MTEESDESSTPPLCFVVHPPHADERLDRFVAHHVRVSRREARILIGRGQVRVNGRTVRILTRSVRVGARIAVQVDASPTPARGATPAGRSDAAHRGDVGLLMLDRWIVAVDKPSGLLSESDEPDAPSLQSVVPKLLAARGERDRVWLVHRLDAGTSGVMVLARTAAAARALSDAFRHGQAHKSYVALCSGRITAPRLVDAPIARMRGVRHGVAARGKPSQTDLEPLAHGVDVTLVRARPRTGRTHQIRVHLTHAGHPILGDRLYGGRGYTAEAPPQAIGRPMLHAHRLEVPHPNTRKRITLTAPVPVDLADLATRLGIDVPAELRSAPEEGKPRHGPEGTARNG